MTCRLCGHPVHGAWRCLIPDGLDPLDLCECPAAPPLDDPDGGRRGD